MATETEPRLGGSGRVLQVCRRWEDPNDSNRFWCGNYNKCVSFKTVDEGDLVVVLFGGVPPFLLRRVNAMASAQEAGRKHTILWDTGKLHFPFAAVP